MLKNIANRFLTKGPFGHRSPSGNDPDIVDGKIVEPAKMVQQKSEYDFTEIRLDDLDTTLLEMVNSINTDGPQAKAEDIICLEDIPADLLMSDSRVIEDPKQSGMAAYWLHLEAKGRAARTIKEYRYEMTWWEKKAAEKDKAIMALTVHDVEGAVVGLHSATARRKTAALRTYARWAMREGETCLFLEMEKVDSPALPKRLPKDLGTDKFKEISSMAKELTAGRDRCGLWLGFMLCGGLRISEIKTACKSAGMVKVVGKGDKERLVPVPDWIRDGMSTINDRGNGGWRQQKQTIWNQLDKMGIRKPHSLRHTYASELLRRGYALEDVQKLLGHSKIDTTTVYTNVQIPEGVIDALGVN